MLIYVRHMIEDMEFSAKLYNEAEACLLVDELDAGKYHPDAWADFHDLEADIELTPVYGASNQDYCIGFEPAEEFCEVCGHNYPINEPCQDH